MHYREINRRVIDTLLEAPHFAELTGRDGLPCRVWINPTRGEFATALRSSTIDTAGLRGLLTETDVYVWQSINLLHADFERETGVQGVRIALRPTEVQANDESVALPEHFPWIFPDRVQAEAMDIEDRRRVVSRYLQANDRLNRLYATGFTVNWYS